MTVLVTGVSGQLGSVLFRALVRRGERAVGVASPAGPLPDGGECVRADLTDEAAVRGLVERACPDVVIHAAALSSVAVCHADPERARRVNVDATAVLARAARGLSARFVFVSTDMVFDGSAAPYGERSTPSPLSVYGRSKLDGEGAALDAGPALVVRLPLLYGVPAVPRATTFLSQMDALRTGKPLTLFTDEFRSPLALEDAAAALVRAASSTLTGVLHAGGPERLSRHQMGLLLAETLGVRSPNVLAVSSEGSAPERRARDLSFDSSRWLAEFGAPPGRPMRDALRDVVA